jgi:hypothetical protein
MTRTIGIIPAGGAAIRFRGLQKELLPVSETETALDRCVYSMFVGGADEIFIITNNSRNIVHKTATVIYKDHPKLSDVFVTAANLTADWYYFAMPDTVYPVDIFTVKKTAPFMVGTFWTDRPERFGMLRVGMLRDGKIVSQQGQIVDKQKGAPGKAWGALILDSASMIYLARQAVKTYNHTAALNALLNLGYDEFPIE